MSQPKFTEYSILSRLPHLNFLLSLLIVFHHGFTMPVGFNGSYDPSMYGFTMAIERYMYNLSECAVPTFFFLSSYLFYRSFDGTWGQYITKMKRRFWSLVVPYVIFCTIGYCKAKAFNSLEIGGGILGYLESVWQSNTMPLWFIRELIIFSLLSPVIYQIKKSLMAVIVLSIASVILGAMGIVGYQSFLYWMPVYLMGAALNKDAFTNLFFLYDRDKVKVLSIFSLLLYCLWAWFLPNGMEKGDTLLSFEYILFRTVTPAILCFVLWLIIRLDIRDRKWMHYSFFVYCMHAPVIALLKLIYDRLLGKYIDFELLKYIFIISVTYIGCVLMAMLLERYTPKLWGLLNGKR